MTGSTQARVPLQQKGICMTGENESIWRIGYQGTGGTGVGVVVMDKGVIAGADIAGGRWDGSYSPGGDPGMLDVRLTVQFSGHGAVSTVTGRTGAREGAFSETYDFSIPKDLGRNIAQTLRTPLGPIQAVFTKLRDLP